MSQYKRKREPTVREDPRYLLIRMPRKQTPKDTVIHSRTRRLHQMWPADSSQQQDTQHGWLVELKRKIKKHHTQPPRFLLAQRLLLRNDQFCLAKRHQDTEEMLSIKFCRISLFEMHWSQRQNQYEFHSSLLEAFEDRNTETPSLK